jgi:hypothetical protein
MAAIAAWNRYNKNSFRIAFAMEEEEKLNSF